MIGYGDISILIKDILGLAKKIKNQEIIDKLIDLQQLLIDVREENVKLNEDITFLRNKLDVLEKSSETENDLLFSERGFCVKKDVDKRIPYCSHCWVIHHKLIPLSQQPSGGWWRYKCGSCGIDVSVLDKSGHEINSDHREDI